MRKTLQKKPQGPGEGGINLRLSEDGTSVVLVMGNDEGGQEGHFDPKTARDLGMEILSLAEKAQAARHKRTS